jgi:hypothetical protein
MAVMPQVNVPTPSFNLAGAMGATPTPGELGNFAPLPYQDFGNVPYINPAYNDLSAMQGALQGFEGDVTAGLAPTFQQQDTSLQDNLASRGITNTGAATYLNQNLAGNQAAAVAQGDSPIIQELAGNYNTDLLANQQATNDASQFNATAYGTVASGNEQNYNNYLAGLMGQGENYGNELMSGYLGTYQPANSTALGTLQSIGGNAQSAYNGSAASNPWGSAFNNIQWGSPGTPTPPGGGFDWAEAATDGGG